MKIADISHYQGKIDWTKAGKELDFCILRASIGLKDDTRFDENAQGCRDNGIPFGAYHYLKAIDPMDAEREADWFYRQAAPEKPLFYVIDCEYGEITKQLKKDLDAAKDVVSAFLNELRSLAGEAIIVGCYIGHHLYKSWALDYTAFDFIWIPRYGKNSGNPETKPAYPCDIWQYTSKGNLAGVSGRVDLNLLTGRKPLSFFTTGAIAPEPPVLTGDTEEGGATMPYDPKKVLDLAASEVGYLEKASNAQLDSKTANAGNKNYTKYARDLDSVTGFYNGRKQAVAWCDVFVDWLFVTAYGVEAALKLLCQPKKSCGAGCRYSRNYYKAKGQLYDSPKAGDQIFFWPSDRSDPNKVQHTGIVYDVDKTYVYTIEGNTSGASGVIANGGGVCKKKYKLTYARLAGYGRPAYGMEATPEAPVEPVKLGSRTLSKGDEGNDVSELQAALVNLGYDLGAYGAKKDGVDGDFGSKTQKAVMALQEKHGFTETGIFDTAAYNALLEDLNPENPPAENPTDDEPHTVYVLTIYSESEATIKAIQADHGGTITQIEAVG